MAEDTVRRAMVELATKLDTMAQELRKKPEERLVGVEPAVALEKAHLAAQAVSQQARAAFFLDVLACKMEDATACAAQRNGHAENPPESVPRGRRGLQLQATPSLLRRAAC